MKIKPVNFLAKQEALIKCFDNAIRLVKLYMNKFKNNSEYELTVEDLDMGLNNLLKYRSFFIANPDALLEHISLPPQKRPSFGFGRGFGEFLWQGYDWQVEIMDAVHALDKYFRNM